MAAIQLVALLVFFVFLPPMDDADRVLILGHAYSSTSNIVELAGALTFASAGAVLLSTGIMLGLVIIPRTREEIELIE